MINQQVRDNCRTIAGMMATPVLAIWHGDEVFYMMMKEYTLRNPSNHLHETRVRGKNIKPLIDNFDVSFAHDRVKLATTIDRLPDEQMTFSEAFAFVVFG